MIDALRRINPRTLHWICAALGLLWLATIVPTVILPWPATRLDYDPYYIGAVIAREGAWEALYGKPVNTIGMNAGVPDASIPHPRFVEIAEAAGIPAPYGRFVYPPPVALLFAPLAWFDLNTAYWIWMSLLILCAWVVALCAGEIGAIAYPQLARWRGPLTLLVAMSPLAARSLRQGNITCLLAACVGIAVIGLARRQETRAAFGLAIATLGKYAGGILLPIVLAMRAWRCVWWLAALIVVVASSMFITGVEPVRVYLKDILPTVEGGVFELQANQSLPAMVARTLGGAAPLVERPWLGRGIKLGALAALIAVLVLIWKRREAIRRSPRMMIAASAALLAWWPLASPVFWNHYYMYFALFFGWLVGEAMQSRWRLLIVAMILLPMWMSISGLGALQLPEPWTSNMFASSVLLFGFAVWMLSVEPRMKADDGGTLTSIPVASD